MGDSDMLKHAQDVAIDEIDNLVAQPRGRQAVIDVATICRTVKYLYWFGYLAYEVGQRIDADDIKKAIKKFQDWFGVASEYETSKLGPKTMKAFHTSRCGCPDIVDRKNGRHKAYLKTMDAQKQLQPIWQKRALTYYIKDYMPTNVMSKTAQIHVYSEAWKAWADVCRLSFEQVKRADKADMLITTGRGIEDELDGPGGMLAWSYMPEGDDKQLLVKFDLDETWVDDTDKNGVCLFNVACHEFGHMLGLSHSKVKGALMAPFYNAAVANPQLDDDVERIRDIYGRSATCANCIGVPQEIDLTFNGQQFTYILKG